MSGIIKKFCNTYDRACSKRIRISYRIYNRLEQGLFPLIRIDDTNDQLEEEEDCFM